MTREKTRTIFVALFPDWIRMPKMSSGDFQKLQSTWENLGVDDPFWAVASDEDKRGGKWDVREFLATGEKVVSVYLALLQQHLHVAPPFGSLLDFGCGVGRLSLAWSRHCAKVTGVDISSGMLEQARKIASGTPHLQFVHNTADNLAIFDANSFDIVFSHICLQHIPPAICQNYLREFARVCRPGGIVAFQLPTKPNPAEFWARVRKKLVDSLPFGLDKKYRQWRRGSRSAYDVFYTPAEKVSALFREKGFSEIHREPNLDAGEGTEGFIYVFKKN